VEICEFVPWQHILTYVESILRIYNQYGRRDNKYKARIKILVKALGIDEFKRQVEADWADLKDGPGTLTGEEVDRVASHSLPIRRMKHYPIMIPQLNEFKADSRSFSNWLIAQRQAAPGSRLCHCRIVIEETGGCTRRCHR
jgi:sulfite reductase (NADPH) hemoprotein beta-component